MKGDNVYRSSRPVKYEDSCEYDYSIDSTDRETDITTASRLRELIREKQEEVKERTGQRLTHEMIANDIDISKQTFSVWLRDDYHGKYRNESLRILAEYFDVDIDYLKCEQLERKKDEPEDPEKVRSRKVEEYLETIGFRFKHGYDMDPYDPAGEDPFVTLNGTKEELRTQIITDENGEKHRRSFIEQYPDYEYPYGRPIKVILPSGRRLTIRENTFDKYCRDFAEFAEFFATKLIEHAHQDDAEAGILPDSEVTE